jgi:NADH dehydrogenase/NADH:ubiquinone oxidoreductase subunit G
MVGAPLLGANGRGAVDLAPAVARGDVAQVLTSKALLAIGDEPWAELQAGSFARLVLATSQPVPDDSRIDVVLPLAHAYERQASVTNLEGRVQLQEGGAAPPSLARTDWALVAELARRLGVSLPVSDDLEAVRLRLADEHPSYADIVREEALIARV